MPNARLETLTPAKHLGLVEHHATFDRLLGEFAESCLATSGAVTRIPTSSIRS